MIWKYQKIWEKTAHLPASAYYCPLFNRLWTVSTRKNNTSHQKSPERNLNSRGQCDASMRHLICFLRKQVALTLGLEASRCTVRKTHGLKPAKQWFTKKKLNRFPSCFIFFLPFCFSCFVWFFSFPPDQNEAYIGQHSVLAALKPFDQTESILALMVSVFFTFYLSLTICGESFRRECDHCQPAHSFPPAKRSRKHTERVSWFAATWFSPSPTPVPDVMKTNFRDVIGNFCHFSSSPTDPSVQQVCVLPTRFISPVLSCPTNCCRSREGQVILHSSVAL